MDWWIRSLMPNDGQADEIYDEGITVREST